MTVSLAQLLTTIEGYVRDSLGGASGCVLVFKLAGGRKVRLVVPLEGTAGTPPWPRQQGQDVPVPGLSETEALIVEALRGLGAEDWTIGKQVASLAGITYSGHFRTLLVNLCDRGVIQKNPLGQGFRLHPDFRKG